MKNFFALGALAALCQTAFGLEEGTYKIASASLEANRVLSYEVPSSPVILSPSFGIPSQTWAFESDPNEDGTDEGGFLIHSAVGGYLNCGGSLGNSCKVGDKREVYTVELVGDNTYQILAGTRYSLSVSGDFVQLAAHDTSPEHQFVLTPTKGKSLYPTIP
ncbi:hypothetical protein BDV39DRAFT_205420 [Aspergillus sergii]|uniref:Ricin B lectin domain-containing protein n=1 Tax=Aspergillus sergii TaxID=1034303 RepID=A0A5N6X2D0_9EURO|nr:hypothetical protein BDV39DRAFT_205420 [Aspergillus sergii]